MGEVFKIEDGKTYRFISRPLHWSLIEYTTRAGLHQFHDEDENPDEIWELCDD